MEQCNVVIVDDSATAREGLKALLSTFNHVEVIGEASNGREAIEKVRVHSPDVVLMDVHMPVMDGLEATRLIKRNWPECRVVILTVYSHRLRDAMDAGADDFVGKGEPHDRLLEAIVGE
jgi:YesN/AraC family two-component response regulator